jgi:hypothetical protein
MDTMLTDAAVGEDTTIMRDDPHRATAQSVAAVLAASAAPPMVIRMVVEAQPATALADVEMMGEDEQMLKR